MQTIPRRIYRIAHVCTMYGLSRSSIYRLISRGLFPKPVKIGLAAVGWDSDDLAVWYAERRIGNLEEVRA